MGEQRVDQQPGGVRALRAGDRDAWDALWAAYLRFYRHDLDAAVTEATFARLCRGGDDLFGLVAVDAADRPVGFAHVLLHASTWSPTSVCYLEDLFVDPAACGGATGRALIDATLAQARERGATAVYWRTQAFNGRARSLYDQVARLSSDVMYEVELDG
ncbi:GNAT family N-acetyltransferase [Kineococcus rubinsiae]|uniref:GNAT family N-acetyltransferase n=1 Tax=Kineococcus rubinsiae TaxID=2609562 RepID=UPI001AD8D952|nr:GNAT family N-acetyltransferase [Kineococcus rubinsiae]